MPEIINGLLILSIIQHTINGTKVSVRRHKNAERKRLAVGKPGNTFSCFFGLPGAI